MSGLEILVRLFQEFYVVWVDFVIVIVDSVVDIVDSATVLIDCVVGVVDFVFDVVDSMIVANCMVRHPRSKNEQINLIMLEFTITLLFYQIEPLKNGASLILSSSIARSS